MKAVLSFFFQPRIFSAGITLFSAMALIMALIAEHVYNLAPCILCIYQRIPFVITFLLGIIAYKLIKQKRMRGAALMIALSGIAFLSNSALAFYHTGVELHWWASAFEACTFDPTNIREMVKAPPVPCDEIPWADPVLSLSMANWNVIVCGIAGVTCLGFVWYVKKLKA